MLESVEQQDHKPHNMYKHSNGIHYGVSIQYTGSIINPVEMCVHVLRLTCPLVKWILTVINHFERLHITMSTICEILWTVKYYCQRRRLYIDSTVQTMVTKVVFLIVTKQLTNMHMSTAQKNEIHCSYRQGRS